MKDTITLGHGGGRLARDLIKNVFLKHLNNPRLAPLGDSAVFELNGVYLKTSYGSTRILDMPVDDPLPRIC